MKKLLAILVLICSCSVEKRLFKLKSDYITQDGIRYIQSTISNYKGVISSLSESQFIIQNTSADTLYVFSTVLDNINMFYSGKNLHKKGTVLIVDTYYPEYMVDALHSGIKKFNFIQLLPNDSLVVNVDVKRLLEKIGDYSPNKLKLRYYYFEKRGQNFGGLFNISKNKLVKKFGYIK